MSFWPTSDVHFVHHGFLGDVYQDSDSGRFMTEMGLIRRSLGEDNFIPDGPLSRKQLERWHRRKYGTSIGAEDDLWQV